MWLRHHNASKCLHLEAAEQLQAQESTSNDDAESVEAKQEASGPGQRDGADTGSNQDAESVTAREDASEDDSDMEEGEIEGEAAACTGCMLRCSRA